MRVLLGVTSCVRDAQNGNNQAIRDTWGKDLPADVDLRFFIGDGTATGEDEAHIRRGVQGCVDHNRGIDYNAKCNSDQSNSAGYVPQTDEVMLPCPDTYFHLVWKVREMHRWACSQNYDYIFKADTDTFVNVSRLLASGFQNYDFSGGPAGPGSVAGGGGYWTSRRASGIIAVSPVTYWAEDGLVSNALRSHQITLHTDTRYSDNLVTASNDLISTHLGFKPGYHAKMMYDAQAGKTVAPVAQPQLGPVTRRYAADGLTREWVKRG